MYVLLCQFGFALIRVSVGAVDTLCVTGTHCGTMRECISLATSHSSSPAPHQTLSLDVCATMSSSSASPASSTSALASSSAGLLPGLSSASPYSSPCGSASFSAALQPSYFEAVTSAVSSGSSSIISPSIPFNVMACHGMGREEGAGANPARSSEESIRSATLAGLSPRSAVLTGDCVSLDNNRSPLVEVPKCISNCYMCTCCWYAAVHLYLLYCVYFAFIAKYLLFVCAPYLANRPSS
jgi:hypothetical protein